jgi:hypothetical protein
MPVAVVALAAGSFAAGATAFAAATTTLGMIAAGASMVGAAMTIVGTVTGNEKLTKWGSIIGIAGNIGTGLINSAAGEATKAAATAGADAAGNVAADAAAGAATGAADAATAAAGTAGDALGAGMQTFPVAAPPPAAAISMDAGGMLGSGAAPAANAVSAAAPQAASASGAAANSMNVFDAGSTAVGKAAEGASKVFDAGQTAVGQAGKIAGNADITAYIPESTGMLGTVKNGMSSMSAWAKANPELAKAALNGVSAVAGNLAPSAKDKAMMEQYRTQNALGKQQAETAATRLRWGSGRI